MPSSIGMCRSAPQFGCALNGQGERLLAIARAMNGIAVSCQQGGEQDGGW
jgi:hypothetical protein